MGSSKKVTIGYRYYLGMHICVCHGVSNAAEETLTLEQLDAGDRTFWTGSISTNQTLSINEPYLFGGEKKEGGIVGDLDVEFGAPTQGKNAYLQSVLGATDIPAFRGLLTLVVKRMYVASMSPYIKPWSMVVKRIGGKGLDASTAEIAGNGVPGDPDYIPAGSMNAAHIIYECLINSDWGLGLPSSEIDSTSFQDVADTLYAENFGLSLIFAKQSTVEDFIQIVLSHINGILYTDPETGKFTLFLVRTPSAGDISSAISLDESNIIKVRDFQRPSYAEMINEVIVIYRPQATRQDKSITVQDIASVAAQQGIVSQTRHFPGIDNDTIAARVGQREISQYSTPLARMTLVVNREAHSVRPGSIVKFSWDDYGISDMVLRVFSVDQGKLQSGQITLSCTQDIFSQPDNSYIVDYDGDPTDPILPPTDVAAIFAKDLPYWEIENNFSPGDQTTIEPTDTFVQLAVKKPDIATPNFDTYISLSTDVEANYQPDIPGSYCPTAQLTAALPIPTSSGSQVVNIDNMDFGVQFVEDDTYAYINDEVIAVQSVNYSAGTMTIKRGALDSLPQAHADNDIVYFVEDNDVQLIQKFIADPTENPAAGSDSIYIRALTNTGEGQLSFADAAPATQYTTVGRQIRPFPPFFVKIEGDFYPTSKAQGFTTTNITWRSKDRTLQVVKPLTDFYTSADANPPEANTEFVVNFYDEDNDRLREEIVAGGAGSSYSYNYLAQDEADDSGLNFTQVAVPMERLGSAGGTGTTISYSTAVLGDRARPNIPCKAGEKLYAEFNLDAVDIFIGVSNQTDQYRSTNTLNVAYIKIATGGDIGQASTGGTGSGTLTGATGGIAIDTVNEKFWLRNADGSWWEGDPNTPTGGTDFSSLSYTDLYLATANDNGSTNKNITFNFGSSSFAHTPPTGYVAFGVGLPVTVIDETDIGADITVAANGWTATSGSNAYQSCKADTVKTSGQWYFEVRVLELTGARMHIGVCESTSSMTGNTGGLGEGAIYSANGNLKINGDTPTDITTFTVLDRVGVAFDVDTQEVTFYKNGTSVGGPYPTDTTSAMADMIPMITFDNDTDSAKMLFYVTPPSGFEPLCGVVEADYSRLNTSLRTTIYSQRETTIDGSPVDVASLYTYDHTYTRSS